MYVKLESRDDRMGSNFLITSSLLAYAINNSMYIYYGNDLKYLDSPIFRILIETIKIHNNKLLEEGAPFDDRELPKVNDFYTQLSKVTLNIKSDIISFLWRNSELRNVFDSFGNFYNMGYNPKTTIIIHLRLDDVSHRNDYDGERKTRYLKKALNMGYSVPALYSCTCGNQAPISDYKIENVLKKAKENFPNMKDVLIVTSPKSEIKLPYKVLRSQDFNQDLYYLIKAEVLIMSRSTFAMTAAILGRHKKLYCPYWSHVPLTGLSTKYDKSRIEYF